MNVSSIRLWWWQHTLQGNRNGSAADDGRCKVILNSTRFLMIANSFLRIDLITNQEIPIEAVFSRSFVCFLFSFGQKLIPLLPVSTQQQEYPNTQKGSASQTRNPSSFSNHQGIFLKTHYLFWTPSVDSYRNWWDWAYPATCRHLLTWNALCWNERSLHQLECNLNSDSSKERWTVMTIVIVSRLPSLAPSLALDMVQRLYHFDRPRPRALHLPIWWQ